MNIKSNEIKDFSEIFADQKREIEALKVFITKQKQDLTDKTIVAKKFSSLTTLMEQKD